MRIGKADPIRIRLAWRAGDCAAGLALGLGPPPSLSPDPESLLSLLVSEPLGDLALGAGCVGAVESLLHLLASAEPGLRDTAFFRMCALCSECANTAFRYPDQRDRLPLSRLLGSRPAEWAAGQTGTYLNLIRPNAVWGIASALEVLLEFACDAPPSTARDPVQAGYLVVGHLFDATDSYQALPGLPSADRSVVSGWIVQEMRNAVSRWAVLPFAI